MSEKKTVMLTGSSGNMGYAGFKELYAKKDKFNIVLLNRDSEKNHKKFAAYENDPAVRLVWGDLTKYDDVKKAIDGADYVLHVGGMVSPSADYFPKRTFYTNPKAMENIVKAVKAQPDPDKVKVVYIGTVAETGDRNPPIHWARTGDPIKVSIYDHYACSKVRAEEIIADSGLKYWVSLRQSGILYPSILKNFDPIMFHVPINGVLEWATIEDSGLLLERICEDDVPEIFWKRFYNIGSGAEYRLTNFQFEEYILKAVHLGSPKKYFNPNWFITRNFHGQFYADSDELDNLLHFRHNVPVKEYFDNMSKGLPGYYKLSVIAPAFAVKMAMKTMTKKETFGTMDWIKTGNRDRITAYFGSLEAWKKIPSSWKDFEIKLPSMEVTYLDHGYDETKPVEELTVEDLKKAAEFRGGECFAEKGFDFYTPVKWKCARGHEFMMSPNLVLKGGHWCPDCLPSPKTPWKYDEESKINPFFRQVWAPLHDEDEDNVYDFDRIFKPFNEHFTEPKE